MIDSENLRAYDDFLYLVRKYVPWNESSAGGQQFDSLVMIK